MISQSVTKQNREAQYPKMLRTQEPEGPWTARADDDEPMFPAGILASQHELAAEKRARLGARAREQLTKISAVDKVLAGRVRHAEIRMKHVMEPPERVGKGLAAAGLISVFRMLHLVGKHQGHRRPTRFIRFKDDSGGDCNADACNDGRANEPQQNFSEQRPHSTAPSSAVRQNWYPTPRMVLITGRSASSFLRRWLTCMSIDRSKGVALRLYKFSISASRDTTRPAARINTSRMSNSSVVTSIGRPFWYTPREPGSIETPFTSNLSAGGLLSVRRKMALMRAASSRGLNGFGR